MLSFFLRRALTHHNSAFNWWFLYELKPKVCLSKNLCAILHFRFHFIFIRVYVLFNKSIGILTLKSHNSFQNWNYKKATHSFAPGSLTFMLEKEVLRFNDICVSWSFPKPDLETNILNLEKRSFKSLEQHITWSRISLQGILKLQVKSKQNDKRVRMLNLKSNDSQFKLNLHILLQTWLPAKWREW